ncbi:MAG: hypothetical protein V3V33_10210 [Candidatus Lokiarchaeia archaeon]
MIDLTYREEQWLKIFAQDNKFFNSVLQYYENNYYLTKKQFNWLIRSINKLEDNDEDNTIILDKDDFIFLNTQAEYNDELMEILEIYEENGYLDDYEYNQFVHLKFKLIKDKGKDSIDIKSTNNISIKKRDPEHSIIRILCPHCYYRCSPQINFCAKCGEPLKK